MRAVVNLDDILRCPRCHGALVSTAAGYECHTCQVRYPVTDGIASFVPGDAQPLVDKPGDSKGEKR